MLTQRVETSAAQAAVSEYFAGERQEMVLILAAALVVAGLALWFVVSTGAGFGPAFMITVLSFCGLMSASTVSLMIRDQASYRLLSAALQTERYSIAVADETMRIGIVLSK